MPYAAGTFTKWAVVGNPRIAVITEKSDKMANLLVRPN
jgi:hypothetical protein